MRACNVLNRNWSILCCFSPETPQFQEERIKMVAEEEIKMVAESLPSSGGISLIPVYTLAALALFAALMALGCLAASYRIYRVGYIFSLG